MSKGGGRGRPPRPAGHVTVLPAGEEALLLEVDGLDAALALHDAVRAAVDRGEGVWSEVDDLVPAARTVLLVARPGTDLGALRSAVLALPESLRPERSALQGLRDAQEPREVEVPVRYDGADLDDVARLTGLSRVEVVAAHTGMPWRVAFGGFAPGFAYLVGGDPRLAVPRHEHPRPSVPAGAVGIAGEFSGVYPRSSPGGWRLLGTTSLRLWDVARERPALLTPGTTVRFVDAEDVP